MEKEKKVKELIIDLEGFRDLSSAGQQNLIDKINEIILFLKNPKGRKKIKKSMDKTIVLDLIAQLEAKLAELKAEIEKP
jgi:hypothetical protein